MNNCICKNIKNWDGKQVECTSGDNYYLGFYLCDEHLKVIHRGEITLIKLIEEKNKKEENSLFKEWLNSGATNFPEDSYDWWIDKFNQKLEEIEREIEHKAHYSKLSGSKYDGYVYHKDILQIIKNKKI